MISSPVITHCPQRSRGLVKRRAVGTTLSLGSKGGNLRAESFVLLGVGIALEREEYACKKKNTFEKPGEVIMCGKGLGQCKGRT